MAIQNLQATPRRLALVPDRVPLTPNAAAAALGSDTYVKSSVAAASESLAKAPMRPGNALKLLVNGSEAFPELYKQVDSAQHRLDMEFFTFHEDVTGRQMADKLIAKAQSGVQVNLLLDKLSNRGNPLLGEMEQAGVNVRTFTNGHAHPWLNLSDITDHRKILLVDGKVGMTGGMNIGERYEKYWHDLMVKLQGPSLDDMYGTFEHNWKLSDGSALRPVEKQLAAVGESAVQIAETAPTKQEIRDTMFAAFKSAKKRIMVQSPYFIDPDFVDHLKAAAQRGVKVYAQLPTVGDNPLVDLMNRDVVNELLEAGVQVRQFDTLNKAIGHHDHVTDHFNHAKVAVVDGQWTAIGTANADTRSMLHNQELNLNVDSKKFAHDVEKRVFGRDFATISAKAAKQEISTWEKPLQVLLKSVRRFF